MVRRDRPRGEDSGSPVEAHRAPRILGADRGQVWIASGALDPLSDEELALWYDAPLISTHDGVERG